MIECFARSSRVIVLRAFQLSKFSSELSSIKEWFNSDWFSVVAKYIVLLRTYND